MTVAATRTLGLIRVSKERDGMLSPEMQRASIEAYAGGRGYHVVDWLEGLDESGSRNRSGWWPRLEEAVGRVESGEVEVILVWKYSRTARHRLRWAMALDRVESAGGQLESATEQVDARTSTGRFTRGMLAELNAFEAERIGEVWKEVHARRVSNGRPYRCAAGKDKGPEACTGGYVVAAYVERAVFAWLVEHRDLLEEPVRRLALPQRSDIQVSQERLRRVAQAAEEALARLVVQNATIPLPKIVYVRAEQQLLERLRAAQEGLVAAERGDGAPASSAGFQCVDELLERWDVVPVPHRREVLRQVVERVSVKTGRPSATIDVRPSVPAMVTSPRGGRPGDRRRVPPPGRRSARLPANSSSPGTESEPG